MINASIVSVGQAQTTRPTRSFADIGDRLVGALRSQEEALTREFREVLDASSPLMALPQPLREQFRQWDRQAGTPEEIRAAKVLKNKILDMHQENQDYIRTKVRSGIDKAQFELAVKAIGKTMSGVQQLLSSQ